MEPIARAPLTDIDGPAAWARAFVTVLLGTIGSCGMWVAVVVLPDAQTEFGVARGDASLPYAATMIGFGLGNIIIGRIADKVGITAPAITAAIMLCAGFAFAANATELWQLVFAQGALIGIATGAAFGPLIADLSHWFRKRRGLAVGAAASGNYIAGAVWPPLVQAYVATEGWREAYIARAVFCLVSMIPLALMLRTRLTEPSAAAAAQAVGANLRQMPFSPRTLQWLLAIAGVGCCVAMSMPQVHIVSYCIDLGFGPAVGAEMLALMSLGGVASRLASGFLADYIGGIRTLLIGSVAQCAALFFFLPFDTQLSLYIVSLMFGLSQGGIVPSYAIVVREYLPAKEAGERIGVIVASTILGMALGGWMSGVIFDQTGSYSLAFVNGIAWNLLNIVIVLGVMWRTLGPHQGPALRPA